MIKWIALTVVLLVLVGGIVWAATVNDGQCPMGMMHGDCPRVAADCPHAGAPADGTATCPHATGEMPAACGASSKACMTTHAATPSDAQNARRDT